MAVAVGSELDDLRPILGREADGAMTSPVHPIAAMAFPRWLAMAILSVVTVAVWIPPLAVLLTLATVAVTGCHVDEATEHPCLVAGHDIGPALSGGIIMAFVAGPSLLFAIGSVFVWVKLLRSTRRASEASQ